MTKVTSCLPPYEPENDFDVTADMSVKDFEAYSKYLEAKQKNRALQEKKDKALADFKETWESIQ